MSRSAKDGWVTIDGRIGEPTRPVTFEPVDTQEVEPLMNTRVLLPRIDFQKKRLLDRHHGLLKNLQRVADELQAVHDRIANNDVQDADYNAIAQAVASSLWISLEASGLDAAKQALRAIEGKRL